MLLRFNGDTVVILFIIFLLLPPITLNASYSIKSYAFTEGSTEGDYIKVYGRILLEPYGDYAFYYSKVTSKVDWHVTLEMWANMYLTNGFDDYRYHNYDMYVEDEDHWYGHPQYRITYTTMNVYGFHGIWCAKPPLEAANCNITLELSPDYPPS